MKNSKAIWLSCALIAALALGNTIYAKKGGSASPKISKKTCEKIHRWETEGTFTDQAGPKYEYYVQYLDGCRAKHPDIMKPEDARGSADETDEAVLAAQKKCLKYRTWNLKKNMPAKVKDATTVLSQCKTNFPIIFKKPKKSLCGKYQKWFDQKTFTKNRGNLIVAELCRIY